MVSTHIWGRRFFCLNRRAIIIPKEKKQYLWQRIWITSTKEEHKVSSGIGKVLTINKTSSDFYAFMHIFISQGEFTDCKNEHVLWLMSVCKCALFRQMFWRGVHAYMKISIRKGMYMRHILKRSTSRQEETKYLKFSFIDWKVSEFIDSKTICLWGSYFTRIFAYLYL